MRLTCPRCAAQYEIAAAAIPATGREVECSACGHVWHQPGQIKTGAAPAASRALAAQPRTPLAQPPAAPEAPPPAPQAPAALSRPMDDSVLSILIEETAREMQAREAEAAARAQARDWPAATVTGEDDVPQPSPVAPQTRTVVTTPPPAGRSAPKAEPGSRDHQPPVSARLPDAAELAATLTRLPDPPAPALARSADAPAPAEPVQNGPGAGLEPLAAAGPGSMPAENAAPPQPPRANRRGDPRTLMAESLVAEAADLHIRPAQRQTRPPMPAVPASRPRRAYAMGLALGLAVTLALGLAHLLLPPTQPAAGPLAQLRQQIDQGRLWLHQRLGGDAAQGAGSETVE
ncbi:MULTISPECIES: zinc-ribbon domain-containing protein [unclassified Paracoccus (in: a-proteobacteria)]|uniref:zinc-ribbon domain-containing protein n=1 Tax=unclassified Paracoccus (in: a-proteobacteria) TaxID=2688777 RepID=UPI0021E17E66|nr:MULTISPECIES: zinc-ribbon domain-containing protein [unclassified Paracoccus (in: a-proteobacteria)]UXU75057.1 zinc-ribbon domain-containing protein [Paracoccus sp. SMMA_5]UXU80960.1 zinc-ribbon domain-containing protein [Paracoccus sp. SMMA_5_TC]